MKGHKLDRFELGTTHGFWGALIGAGVSLLGSKMAGDQAERGSRRAEGMGMAELAQADYQYQQGREDTRPWREAGAAALEGLAGGISDLAGYQFEFDPSSVGQSDAYKWRVEQGTQAADRAMIAAGGSISGERVQGLMDLGQRMGSQEYEAEFNRQMQTSMANYGFRSDHLNRLAQVAGLGGGATGTLASLAGNLQAGRSGTVGGMMDAAVGAADRRAAATRGMFDTGVGFMRDMAYRGNTDFFEPYGE